MAMKGPPKLKAMKGIGRGSAAKVGGGVAGGNMSGLSAGLMAARPKKAGRVTALKQKMFGGGM